LCHGTEATIGNNAAVGTGGVVTKAIPGSKVAVEVIANVIKFLQKPIARGRKKCKNIFAIRKVSYTIKLHKKEVVFR
jgi:serine acetyltransferase